MTMKMHLPSDLVEEIFSRVPIISLKRLRSTCKRWNALFQDQNFTHKHFLKTKESLTLLLKDFRVCSMNVNLNVAPPSVEFKSALDIKDSYYSDSRQVDIVQVFHCDGLLLCISKDNARLVVWNLCLGETRWIEPTDNFKDLDMYRYALGYDKSTKSHKILRFIEFPYCTFVEFKIYDFYSDSWRVLDLTPDWEIPYYYRGVSIRGNTYWFATKKYLQTRLLPKWKYSKTRESDDTFLLCFDFTKMSFGPRLPLPFEPDPDDTVSLSSVREEQLAVLFQPYVTLRLEIWVTTKIEPNAVSWNNKVFLEVDLRPLIHFEFQFPVIAASFFIDEEKKVAVVFDKDEDNMILENHKRNIAYIIGVDGSLKEVELGGNADQHCVPLVCSYVPSLVQLK